MKMERRKGEEEGSVLFSLDKGEEREGPAEMNEDEGKGFLDGGKVCPCDGVNEENSDGEIKDLAEILPT